MGKATKWFRGLLGLKNPPPPQPHPPPSQQQSHSSSKSSKEKRRWSFVKSYREKATDKPPPHHDDIDPNHHAIAVAAATAAVAEAAVAAAHAAAAVVRLTSSGRCANPAVFVGGNSAAIKIQAVFRGYLGRKALRALKAVVRLQALVRGHIERKRTAEWLQRMQALLRAQARARAGRISESSYSSGKSSQFHHPGPATPEKFEHAIRAKSLKYDQLSMLKRNGSRSSRRVLVDQDKAYAGWNRSDRRMDERSYSYLRQPSMKSGSTENEKSDKILEIDTGKPQSYNRRNLFHSSQQASASDQISHSYTTSKDSTTHQTVPSSSSYEVQSLTPLKFCHDNDESPFCTANNSPQFFSATSMGGSSRRSPFTPTKSDGSRSYLSGYSDHPNYMAYTESSKAKARSLSAPKQRPEFERSSSTKRYSIHGFGESKSITQRVAFHGSKAYPGSGRLDRLGMPAGYKC